MLPPPLLTYRKRGKVVPDVLFTTSVDEPLMELEVAIMVAVPTATPVTRPWLPAELLTVATFVADELQVAV